MKIIEKGLYDLSKKDYDKYIKLNKKSRNFFIFSSIYCACIGIYNPYLYLSILIISNQLELTLKKNMYKSKSFDELEYYYATYITKICNLLRKLNIDNNPIEAYQFLVTLCKTGHISKSKEYKYSNEKAVNVPERSMLGSSVVTGYGVCRNISYLIHDILNELGYDIDMVYLNVHDIKKLTYDGIEYKGQMLSSIALASIKNSTDCEDLSIEFEKEDPFNIKHGNHLILGMEENNQYLLLDPTNEILYFSLSSFENLKGIESLKESIQKFDKNTDRTYKATDKTILLSDRYDIACLKEAYKLLGQKEDGLRRYEQGIKLSLMNEKLDRLITKKQRPNNEFDKADEAFCSNKDLISDFYEENSSFYDDYANKILSLFN